MINKLFKSKVKLTDHELDVKIRNSMIRISIFAVLMILCVIRIVADLESKQTVSLFFVCMILIAMEIIFGTNYFKRVEIIDHQE